MTSIFDQDFETHTNERPATERQLSFIESLREQYDAVTAEIATLEGRPVEKRFVWGPLPTTISAASTSIEKGKAAVAKLRDQRNALRVERNEEIEEGFYVVNWSGDNAQLYMVKESGAGNLYAMTWSTEEDRWIYTPGGMRHIADAGRKADRDAVASFGRTHGYCMVCGRLLTNPESVERGIGPICAERF